MEAETTPAPANDLERIIPTTLRTDDPIEREMLELHLERYRFAAQFVEGKRVIDMACGVGYGSAHLRESGAESVLGVDLSESAIEYANGNYAVPGIEFRQANAMEFTPENTVDVAVSLETIEHLPDPETFVARLSKLVPPGGIVVGSVPTTLSSDVNPYHLHDFTARSFRTLFEKNGLEIVDEMDQRQPYSVLGILNLSGKSQRDYGLRKGLVGYYLRHPDMAFRRLGTTLTHGFVNKYLVLAGRRSAE